MGLLSPGESAPAPVEPVAGPGRTKAEGVSCHGELLLALRRLDRRLAPAFEDARSANPTDDPYRGLYIDPTEPGRLFALAADDAALTAQEEVAPRGLLSDEAGRYPARLSRLGQLCGLSAFDLDLLVIALAPELDPRYERLYAFLQDDVTRRRPTVGLALDLLCASPAGRLDRRAHFAPAAPLVREGLLELVPDPNQTRPPLLAHYLKPDERIVGFLLEEEGIDPRLAPLCRRIEPDVAWDELPVLPETAAALRALLKRSGVPGSPLRLYFHGPRGAGKRLAADALAAAAGTRLLVADLGRALASGLGFEQAVRLLFREARINEDALLLEGFEALRGGSHAGELRCLADAVCAARGLLIIAGERARADGLDGLLEVSFPAQDFRRRRDQWERSLGRLGGSAEPAALATLAGRFRLTHGRIEMAVANAVDRARWREAARQDGPDVVETAGGPTIEDLFACARELSGGNLPDLARAVEPRHGWGDIVLPADQLSQLREICSQAARRHVVYGDWGFGRKLSLGKGLNALFSGPPGTGKTMAAEVIAADLGLGLYKIDLSQVVSKYIGETEKNLESVFREAQSSSSILFFDEADALFGKRSEVKDAHDRYANIEIGYLLQRMEEFDGVAVLATNLRHHLDEAFVRRMHFIVEFPFPDEEHRRSIWEVTFPREAPLADDVDLGHLAREVKLAGGQIKNIALAAAFYAATDGSAIRMSHLMRAARREHQKLGRVWDEREAGPPAAHAPTDAGGNARV